MVSKEVTGRPRVAIILGPTGVGKSQLALDLAEELGGEIVSADSMQVYRLMDIGTDKPCLEDRKRVRHHMLDLVLPDQPFHAGLFRALARRAIEQISARGKVPLVVGGTGLYIKSLTHGLFQTPAIDPAVRGRLKGEGEAEGGEFLYRRLLKVDPKTAGHLHPNDLFRIVRALEVFESTGVPISFFRDRHGFGESPYSLLKIGLAMDREKLYRRIEERVDRMMARGFLDEVERLLAMGYGSQLKPMQSLGYKQLVGVLLKNVEQGEAIRQIKRDTRRYAKRQWTWFRTDPEVLWSDESLDRKRVLRAVSSFFKGGE